MIDQLKTNKKNIAQIYQQFKRLVSIGIVEQVDCYRARVRLPDQGNVVSDWLLVVTRRAKGAQDVWLPVIGEQVLCLFLPLDGMSVGFVLGSLNSSVNMPPDANGGRHILFEDGTSLEYDLAAHEIRVQVSGGLKVSVQQLDVSGNMSVSGDMSIDGDVSIDGDMSIDGDAEITGKAQINSDAEITGTTKITGNLMVLGQVDVTGIVKAQGFVNA